MTGGVVIRPACGCIFPSDGPPIPCPQHEPRHILIGRWVCGPCRVIWRGAVLAGEDVRHEVEAGGCGRLMRRSSGDELIGAD